MPTAPLQGYKVIELSSMISGPNAAVVLADQGAEVIKVEPLHGDLLRMVGYTREGLSPMFVGFNRNKKSIAINLKHPDGAAIIRDLARDADVVVQNFRPGVLERLGLGFADLKAENPTLIYAAISGFGDSGPYARRPAYDAIIQGLSGVGFIQGAEADDSPALINSAILDKLTGLMSSQAITAALCARERTGEGSHLHIAMLDVAVSFLWPDVMAEEIFGDADPNEVRSGKSQWMYPTRDGFITALPHSNEQFRKMAELADRLDWLEDERFSSLQGRGRNFAALGQELAKAFRGRTTQEWLELLEEADIAHGEVLRPTEVRHNAQVVHSETIVTREHPTVGPLRECRGPAIFDGEKQTIRSFAPALGEHTDELLRGLGLSPKRIEGLRADGVVAGPQQGSG